jgi:hypothetical protein
MKTLLVLLIALLPLQAQAQEIQLTLNCEIERAHDFKTRQAGPSSGSFSAIVHMSNSQDATIEVTFCFNYVGSLREQEVIGECKRTVGDSKYWAYLTINRINGEFEHVFTSSGGSAEIEYLEGHCTPGKKLF